MDNSNPGGKQGVAKLRGSSGSTEWEYTTTESERSSEAKLVATVARKKILEDLAVEVEVPQIAITRRRGVASLVLEPAGTFQDNLPKNKVKFMPSSNSKTKIRSPFGLFMKEQAEVLKQQGVNIPNGFKGLADHLTPQWNAMTEAEKSYWQTMSEKVKAGNSSACSAPSPTMPAVPKSKPKPGALLLEGIRKNTQKAPMGVTTFGNPIIPNEDAILMELEEYITVRAKVENFFATPGQNSRAILNKKMIILDMNPYCGDMDGTADILPAEWAATSFSINQGLMKTLWGMINPGYIPLGAASEIRDSVLTCALAPVTVLPVEAIDQNGEVGLNCASVLQNIEDLLGQDEGNKKNFVFVMRDNVEVVRKCLSWMSKMSGKPVKCEVIPLSVVLELLSTWNTVGVSFQLNEVEADRLLKKVAFAFEPTITCEWHMTGENCYMMDHCAKNGAQRTVYNFLDYMCPLFNVEMRIPNHSPVLTQDPFLLRHMGRALKQVETSPESPPIASPQVNSLPTSSSSSKHTHSIRGRRHALSLS